jgi:hypothetical protein
MTDTRISRILSPPPSLPIIYDGGMETHPIQFSLGRLLRAVTCFCIAFWGISEAFNLRPGSFLIQHFSDGIRGILWFVSVTALGGGIGILFGRFYRGAFIGFIGALVIGLALALATAMY